MARNKIGDLRDHLFEVIELLKDNEKNLEDESVMSVAKANAIAKVAQTIINSAKLEIDFTKTSNNGSTIKMASDFLESKKPELSCEVLSSKFDK